MFTSLLLPTPFRPTPPASGLSNNSSRARALTTTPLPSNSYDAVFIGSTNSSSSLPASLGPTSPAAQFLSTAYTHGKPIGALGPNGAKLLGQMGIVNATAALGVFTGDAGTVTGNVLGALAGVVRFPMRVAGDDVGSICQ